MEIYDHNRTEPPASRRSDRKTTVVWLSALSIVCALLLAAVIALSVCLAAERGKPAEPSPAGGAEAVEFARKSTVEIRSGIMSGSGVVVDVRDLSTFVITDYHVIASGTSPSVRFYSDNDFVSGAEVLGYDVYHDIAVLRVPAVSPAVRVAAFLPAAEAVQGLRVYSAGNDMLKGVAVYEGLITNPARMFKTENLPATEAGYKGVPVYQTSAVVNSGMSGGGLFDAEGRLAGINAYGSAVAEDAANAPSVENVGYAVPGCVAEALYREIVFRADGGQIGRVAVAAAMDANGILRDADNGNPVLSLFGGRVSAAWRGEGLTIAGAADSTELKAADVVTAVGNAAIGRLPDYAALFSAFLDFTPDENGGAEYLSVTVLRDGKTLKVKFRDYYLKNYLQ